MTTKIFLPIFAAIAAVAMAFGTSGLDLASRDNNQTAQDYYLKTGMDANDALNAANYQTSIPIGVICNGTDKVPCYFHFIPSEEFPTFEDFLLSKTTTTVVTDATSTRSIQ